MPIIKSAKKRVRVAKRATSQNLRTKRLLRSSQKEMRLASDGKDAKAVTQAQRKNQSALDKASKKGLMHKNKVARKQRQLAAKAKVASQKSASPVKKTAKKKAPAKK